MIVHQTTNSHGNYNYNAFIYSDVVFASHFHGNYELIYVIEGSTSLSLNSISENLQQGELILISPYTVHTITIPKNSYTWIGVFSSDFIPAFAEKNKFISFSKFRCEKSVEDTLRKHLFTEDKPEKYLHIACLYMVCSECTKNAVANNVNRNNDFMHKVIEYISCNLSDNITLKEISQELNYEYHYFSLLFNQNFSINFRSFINTFRFENACKLLTSTSDNITTVCDKCGFGSIRNFNRVFKQSCGLTPNEYRKSFLK